MGSGYSLLCELELYGDAVTTVFAPPELLKTIVTKSVFCMANRRMFDCPSVVQTERDLFHPKIRPNCRI